jgi:hypothetical protein
MQHIGLCQNQRWSIGGQAVLSNYQGDLVEQLLALKETKLGAGVNMRYQFNTHFAVRAQAQLMTLTGDDRNSDILFSRGFSYRSRLQHYALMLDYQPFAKRRFDALGYHISNASPYLVAGIGNSRFNTVCRGMANDNPDLFKKAPKNNPTLNGGVGFRWDKNERVSIAIEANTYLVNTDYLDGVSLSGRPNNRDWYVTGGIVVQYWIGHVPDKLKPANPMDVH